MSPDNGHKPPIPFPNANQIPIVGQPFTHQGGFWTEMLTCGCEARTPLLLVGGGVAECPACHRKVTVTSVDWNGQTGHCQVGLGLVMTQADALRQQGDSGPPRAV